MMMPNGLKEISLALMAQFQFVLESMSIDASIVKLQKVSSISRTLPGHGDTCGGNDIKIVHEWSKIIG